MSAAFPSTGQQVLTASSHSAASRSDGQQVLTALGSQTLNRSGGLDDPEGDIDHDLGFHIQDDDHLQESAIGEDPDDEREWELREDPINCSLGFHRFTPSGKAVWDVPLCPRCQGSEESTFHQLWECPHNSNIQGTHLEFLEDAREGHSENPCFWLRGPPP